MSPATHGNLSINSSPSHAAEEEAKVCGSCCRPRDSNAVMALLAAAAGAPSAAEQPAGRIYARRRVGRGGASAGCSSAPAAAAAEPPNTPPNAAAPTAATPATAPNAAPNAAAPSAAAPTAAPNAAGPDNASDGENSDVAAAEEHDDGDEAAETTDGASAWKPEGDFQDVSQRVKTMGDERRFNPILNLDGHSSNGIFEYTEHFLPMHHGACTTRALVPHLVPPPRQPTRPAAAFKHGDGGEQRRPKGRAG